MFRSGLFAASLTAALAVAGAVRPAFAVGGSGENLASRPSKAGLFDGTEPTLAPFAHVVFCKRNPDDCRKDTGERRYVPSGSATMSLLKAVNRDVNASIRPGADAAGPLGDVWNLEPRKGDCDDYAVTKRHRLIAAGLPASALRLAVTRTRSGEGHAVLMVRTEDADIILDSRVNGLRTWREAGLTLVKIQSGDDPRQWFAASSAFAANR